MKEKEREIMILCWLLLRRPCSGERNQNFILGSFRRPGTVTLRFENPIDYLEIKSEGFTVEHVSCQMRLIGEIPTGSEGEGAPQGARAISDGFKGGHSKDFRVEHVSCQIRLIGGSRAYTALNAERGTRYSAKQKATLERGARPH